MRRNLAIATIITMIAASPIFAVGSVNQSLAQIPGSTNYVYTENWTADAANGSVPATVMAGTSPIQGFRIISVEIAPGSPAPTNNYNVTITDYSGADVLGGAGGSQSNTTATVLPSLSNSPPVYGAFTVNVTGNSVNSAQGRVLVYFAPISQIVGNTAGGPSGTGNNLFTGANTFQGTTTFSGPVNSSNTNSFTGTNTFNGALYDCQQNNVLYVGGPITCWAGADIGAQINSAYAALPATGGTINVLGQLGCYSFSTPIVFATSGKFVTLQGLAPSTSNNSNPGGTCLLYTPTTATSAITLDWTPNTGNSFAPGGGIRDITLENQSGGGGTTTCRTAGGCGGSATGINIGPTNGGAHRALFSNLRVDGFATDISVPDNLGSSWGMHFFNSSIAFATTGITFAKNEEGTQIQNSTIILNGTGASFCGDISIVGGSVDSNTTVGLTSTSGCSTTMTITGAHFENLNVAGNVNYITNGAGTVNLMLNGGVMLDDNNSGTTTAWININGMCGIFGTTFSSSGQSMGGNFLLSCSGGTLAYIQDVSSTQIPITQVCFQSNFAVCEVNSNGVNPTWSLFPQLSISEQTAPTGNAGFEKCYGDSTAHTLKCNYNNAGFFAIPQAAQNGLVFDGVYGTYRVTTDQTITAGASLTNIPGLSWTFPANTALNVKFTCDLLYSQATAAASDSFGFQDVTVAPTNQETYARADTSATAFTAGNTDAAGVTTAVTSVTFTPSAATTIFGAHIDGMIEQPSNASTSVFNIMAQFTTNNGTIKRGSSCQVF